MSQIGQLRIGAPVPPIGSITGNIGVIIPDGAGNVNILGAHGINTNGAVNTLTVAINNTITLGDLVGVTGANAITLTTGDITLSAGNINLVNTLNTGQVGIIKYGINNFIHNYGTANTFVGENSGNLTLNVGVATLNTALGSGVLTSLTTGVANFGGGANSLTSLTSGSNNYALGAGSLQQLLTGSSNITLGSSSGINYIGNESANILIGSGGVVADVGITRIGDTGSGIGATACYIAGIAGVNVGNVATVVSIETITNQLGTTTITGGAGIAVAAAAGTITITSTNPAALTWTREAANAVALVASHGYINTNVGLTTLTLPALAAVGDTFAVMGESAAFWTIAQNAGQNIQYGNLSTTPGVGGSLSASNRYDTVQLVCRVANTTWSVVSAVGVLNVV